MNLSKQRSSLLAVFFTFFVDSFAYFIVLPVFAPFFLDPHNVLFSSAVSVGTRTLLFGVFLMAFSLGQFIGSPIIGEYGDKHGRKKALIVSVFFTFVGCVVSAWSMGISNLYLLFFGRLLTGCFSGTAAVCLSCISDLSQDQTTRGKYFGYFAMIGGIGFVFGGFIGGKLADPTISSLFSPTLPLWFSAGLALLNFLFVLFGFEETSKSRSREKFHLLEGFSNIKTALKTDQIKEMYIIFLLFSVSWTILFQFSLILTVKDFGFTSSNIGDLVLFMGACWAIGAGYINKYLVERFESKKILEYSLAGFTLFCGLVVFSNQISILILLLGLCIISGSVGWPICANRISQQAPQEMQGKVLGLSQSVQSFASAAGPILGGLAAHVSVHFTFFIAAILSLVAVTIYYFTLKHR
jgi:DHA1 family tetracycline resistance protein-like MFS transporter